MTFSSLPLLTVTSTRSPGLALRLSTVTTSLEEVSGLFGSWTKVSPALIDSLTVVSATSTDTLAVESPLLMRVKNS